MATEHTRDLRRRTRAYPLPRRGARVEELLVHMEPRDIRHARYSGTVRHLGRGLYGPRGDGSPDELQIATLQALTCGLPRAVSHQTAAAIYGMLDEPLHPPFHITSPRRSSRVKSRRVVGHRSDVPASHIWTWRGIPVTSPAWTWTDLAINSSLVEALILADRSIRPGRPAFGQRAEPLVALEHLREALTARGRANGIRTAAQALDLARIGVDSPQETRLRFYMHEAGLPEPEVNVWLLDEQGQHVVQPDMTLRRWRLAIQYDGEDYHSGAQMRKDVWRTERTEALGWKEVRITKDHMYGGGRAAIAKIERELRGRGWKP